MQTPISVATALCGCLLLDVMWAGCGSGGDGLIHSRACTETFTACGGDPVGIWDIVAICTDGNIADEYNKAEEPACSGLRESVTLAAAGSVQYTPTAVTYDGKAQEAISTNYSPACAQATQGITSLDSGTCQELQRANTNSRIGKVSKCELEGGNCRCSETRTVDAVGSFVYRVIAGGTAIVEEAPPRYEFCVQGNTMRQRENIYGNAYAVTTLKKR